MQIQQQMVPTNQQTNKPAEQQTSRATEQQSNRATTNIPAKQQTSQQQSDQKIFKQSQKNHPKSTKHRPKIDQKSTKMAPKLVLEGLFGGSWGHLGPKSQQEPQKCVRPPFDPPSWRPIWRRKSTKIDQQFVQNVHYFLTYFSFDF